VDDLIILPKNLFNTFLSLKIIKLFFIWRNIYKQRYFWLASITN